MDRRRIFRLLDPEASDRAARSFRLLHHLMVALGTAVLLADTVPEINQRYLPLLDVGFFCVAGFFIAEYLARLSVAPEAPGGEVHPAWDMRLRWMISAGGLLDFIGALPALLTVIEREPAMLFSGVWIFKYIRYSPGLASLRRVIAHARQPLLSVLLGFIIVLVTAANLEYLLERQADPAAFGSMPKALWWAIVTLTTTGYGDVVPSTAVGRLVAGVVMISGILVFALWAGILATGYAQESRRLQFLRTWNLVAGVPFFHDLGASLISDVANLLRPRDYPAGATVIRKGEHGDRMFFIVEGEVEILLEPQSVVLDSGHFFGELALLTRAPRNASVIARSACTLLSLDVVDFHELLGRRPEVARAIRAEAARRLGPQPDQAHAAAPELATEDTA